MLDKQKEFIAFLRNRSNHALVLIVTLSASVIGFALDETYNVWFYFGVYATVLSVIVYIYLTIIEFETISKLNKEE
jgi:membrane protein YdbS with pleckstrin-like domain